MRRTSKKEETMEERIVDDEFGRGIRLKKRKDGTVDVEDALAEETDTEEQVEELEVILPTDGDDKENEAPMYVTTMDYDEQDDEDLVDLTPEEAARVRKEKAAELRRRKEAYKKACADGEQLLNVGSYHAAELAFEKALKLDEVATEASVGYWRAKTANFTDPDALVEEYLEEGLEGMETDLGFRATDIIKRDYRAAFEMRLKELSEQEAPILKEVEEKQARRRSILKKRCKNSLIVFLCGALPFIGMLIATALVGLKNFSTPDDRFIIPTIVCGCITAVAFIASLITTNLFFNAIRMYRMNEKLSSTDEGKAVLEIREYKAVYEALLYAPVEEAEYGEEGYEEE